MRIAIISDIHSNLEALEKSLEVIKEKSVDEIICLGDIIGYGANPNECIDLVRETTPHVLLGNHDEAAIELSKTEYFNALARMAAEWTSRELTEENRQFVRSLPFFLTREEFFLVHASPHEPAEWHYILSPVDAQVNFQYFGQPLCFVGHSHVPGIFSEDIWTQEVVPEKKFIVNVGSIGQPRDNDWRLSFGIFDTEKWIYENIRADNDVANAAAKIKKEGLPKPLAERLFVGR